MRGLSCCCCCCCCPVAVVAAPERVGRVADEVEFESDEGRVSAEVEMERVTGSVVVAGSDVLLFRIEATRKLSLESATSFPAPFAIIPTECGSMRGFVESRKGLGAENASLSTVESVEKRARDRVDSRLELANDEDDG